MDEQTYLTERVDDQMNWYDRKSSWNQKRYKRLRFIATGLSLLIPFATGFLSDEREWVKWSIGIAGILIAVIEYVLSMNNYHENWVEYRATAEALKREKILYLTKSGHYKVSDAPFQDFVEICEAIMAGEQENWKNSVKELLAEASVANKIT